MTNTTDLIITGQHLYKHDDFRLLLNTTFGIELRVLPTDAGGGSHTNSFVVWSYCGCSPNIETLEGLISTFKRFNFTEAQVVILSIDDDTHESVNGIYIHKVSNDPTYGNCVYISNELVGDYRN